MSLAIGVAACAACGATQRGGPPSGDLAAFSAERIIVDGRLDEAAWSRAPQLGPFVGPSDDNGRHSADRPGLRSTARVIWQADALVVGYTCLGPPPWNTHLGRDQRLYENDVVELFLDPLGDGSLYLEAQASHRGMVSDWLHRWTAAEPGGEASWSSALDWDLPGLEAAGAWLIEDGEPIGWTLELALPLKPLLELAALSTQLHAGQILRMNLVRYQWLRQPEAEPILTQSSWSPVALGCPHISPQAMRPIRLHK